MSCMELFLCNHSAPHSPKRGDWRDGELVFFGYSNTIFINNKARVTNKNVIFALKNGVKIIFVKNIIDIKPFTKNYSHE